MEKTTTNQIPAGTRVTMEGTLDEFTWYVNHLLEGEKLQAEISRQKAAGWKFPNTNARSEFRIVDPKPAAGTDVANPAIAILLTYLKEHKLYTDKEGVTTLLCVKSAKIPLMGVLNAETGRVTEVLPTGMLEAGQKVQVEFSCYGTKKGNNGVSVNTVVFLEEPKVKQSLPNWDRLDRNSTSTPAAQAAAPAAPATPVQAATPAAPDNGFVPADDVDIPWPM